ncbi:MAG: hypothetical protein RI565_06000 [Schleiferiaceae bacterium]|nr:hypothetical protein [Schleiferiaceae bacterium]
MALDSLISDFVSRTRASFGIMEKEKREKRELSKIEKIAPESDSAFRIREGSNLL